MSDLVVRPCSHEAAKHAVMRWHYSRTMPPPRLVRYGVWENRQFVGAIIYGRGNAPNIGKPYALDQTQVCELVRVALRQHETPVTRMLRITRRMLRESSPGMRLLVSFADPHAGHHGAIYQADNWLFVGRMPPTTVYVDAYGREHHSRVVSPSGWKRQFGEMKRVLKTDDLTPRRRVGKLKYLYPLDRAMRRQVAGLAKPYPSADEVSKVRHPGSTGEGQVRPLPSAPSG